MKINHIKTLMILMAMASALFLVPNAFGQDMGAASYNEGYGSYDRMGQDPDAVLLYGRDMMRYGFHEQGMPGGSNKYPGYSRRLDNNTIKKMNAEQEAFIKATENFRQTIYEKELYLKAELAKKLPDKIVALQYQSAISEARGKYEQIMIEHIIRMKKINLEAVK
jgi:hypothetical protein